MKKILFVLLLAFTTLTIFGCKTNTPAEKPAVEEKEDDKKDVSSEEGKDDKNDAEEKKDEEEPKEEMTDKKVVTVTTSFLDDMVRNIAGDTVEIEMIIPAGEDPHLYVMKPTDLEKYQKANLVLYHGLHFEGKMVDILEEMGKSVSKNFPEDKIGEFDEDGEITSDPHFWFDLDLYKMAVEEATVQLKELNPDLKDEYQKNSDAYLAALDELDKYNREKLEAIPKENRYLITPHDAFNYFSRRYDIPVMAPQGVSTDGEVSIKDMEETANFIAEHKVKAIFAESTTDPKRMVALQDLVKSKGFEVNVVSGEGKELFSDSLAPHGEFGDTFIDMYKHNVDLIADNLK